MSQNPPAQTDWLDVLFDTDSKHRGVEWKYSYNGQQLNRKLRAIRAKFAEQEQRHVEEVRAAQIKELQDADGHCGFDKGNSAYINGRIAQLQHLTSQESKQS